MIYLFSNLCTHILLCFVESKCVYQRKEKSEREDGNANDK